MAETATQPGSRTFQPDSDVHVSLEDQGKINQFASCSAKNDEVKALLIIKQNQLQNLEDACEELALADEDDIIPFQCGEIFVYKSLHDANKTLDDLKNKVIVEIGDLKDTSNELKSKMTELKTHLYAKFGNRINLEEEEE